VSKRLPPTPGSAHPAHDETRQLRIERTQLNSLPRDQVHRCPEKAVSAKRCEPHDHEIALSDGVTQPMAVMKTDNPGAVAIDPLFRLCGIEPAMRFAEIQEQGNLGRRKVSFANRVREKTRTRQVTSYKRAKMRMSTALRHPPLSQLRCVLVCPHALIAFLR
jgi:hypothetical protein